MRGASLIGNGLDALARITAMGSDLEIDHGVCGKAGQDMPVGVGQPTMRMDAMTVGGIGG